MLKNKNNMISESTARFTRLENILNVQTIIQPNTTEQTLEINNVKFSDYKVVNPSCTNFWNVNNVSETLGNNIVSTTFFENDNTVTLSNKFWSTEYGTNLTFDQNAVNPNNSLVNTPNDNSSMGEPDQFKNWDNTLTAVEEQQLNDLKNFPVSYSAGTTTYSNAININYTSPDYGKTNGIIADVKILSELISTVFTNNSGRFLCIMPKIDIKVIVCEYEISSPDNNLKPFRNRLANLLTRDAIPSFTDVNYLNMLDLQTAFVKTNPINHYCVLPYCKYRINLFMPQLGQNISFKPLSEYINFFYSPFSIDCPLYTNIYNNFYLTENFFQSYDATHQNLLYEIPNQKRKKLLNGLLLPLSSMGNTVTTLTGVKYKDKVDNIIMFRYNAIEILGDDTISKADFFYINKREAGLGWADNGANGSLFSSQWGYPLIRDSEQNFTIDISKLSFQLAFYNETNKSTSEIVIDGSEGNKIMNMYVPRQRFIATSDVIETISNPIALSSTLSFAVDEIVLSRNEIGNANLANNNIFNLFSYDNIASYDNITKNIFVSAIARKSFEFGYFSNPTSNKIVMLDFVMITFDFDAYDFIDPMNFYIISTQSRKKRSFPIKISSREFVFCGIGLRNPDYGDSQTVPSNTTMYINLKFKEGYENIFDLRQCTYRTMVNSFYRFKNVEKLVLTTETQLIRQQPLKSYMIQVKSPFDATLLNMNQNQIKISTPSNYLITSPTGGFGVDPKQIICNLGSSAQFQNLQKDNSFLLLVLDSGSIIQSYTYNRKQIQDDDVLYIFNPTEMISATATFELGFISRQTLSNTGSVKINNGLGANILKIANGWYSGLEGVNELIRLLKTILPATVIITFNQFTNKLTFETKADGFVLNFTTKDSFDKESSARLYGFAENTSLLEFKPNTIIESPLELDPYFNDRFAFIQINLLNFANFGFLNESLGLIKIFAKNQKSTLSTTYLNQFTKILPRNSPLSNLKLEVTDGRGIKISSLEPIYLDFLIECYN